MNTSVLMNRPNITYYFVKTNEATTKHKIHSIILNLIEFPKIGSCYPLNKLNQTTMLHISQRPENHRKAECGFNSYIFKNSAETTNYL